jgi:signal transduction histidine kinase
MKLLDLAPLLGAICNLCLALFVLASDRRSKINQVFFFWILCVATWNACTFALFRTAPDNQPEAMRWAVVLQYAVIFIPISMLHLSLLIAGVKPGRVIVGLYLFHALLAASNAMGWFISGVQYVGYAWYSVAGPAFYVYSCAFVQTGVAIYILYQRRAAMPPQQQARLNALLAAQVLLVVLGTNDLLPIVGITKYPFTDVAVFPYGSIAAIFYGIVVGYAVMQHQLLDVHVALGRNTALLVRFAFLVGIGLALQITITVLAPDQFTPLSFLSSMVVLAVSTILATILFPRLLGSTVERLDRKVQGDRFEAQDRVRGFVESMIWYDDLDALLDDLHSILVRTLDIGSYKIILRDEVLQTFALHRAHPPEDGTTLPDIKINSPIFQYFEWSKSEYLALNARYARPGESNIGRLARRQFASAGAEFAFPLTSQNEPFGLLLVGERGRGSEYSGTDIAMLVGLVKNLSLMVNQVRLKTQIRQNQDFELLGKMSRGMAHDLNNLLTPISTLLQLSTELGPGAPLDDELLPVAMRNVKTMRAYIRESLFFSENLRLQLQTGALDEVIRESVETSRSSRDKPVTVEVDAPAGVQIEMDSVLLQRLVANLVSNAIDASAPGSTIHVRLERLPKSDGARDWVRLRVVDQGEGISKENLSRVLTPYFTTKNRGDSNRGFGLGLAICRKIVNLHGGNLSIASQIKKGTTVQVDLPTRQSAPTMPTIPVPA